MILGKKKNRRQMERNERAQSKNSKQEAKCFNISSPQQDEADYSSKMMRWRESKARKLTRISVSTYFHHKVPQHLSTQTHTNSTKTTKVCSHHSFIPTWSQCGPPLAAHIAPQSVWGPVWPAARPQCNHHSAARSPRTILRAHIQNHGSSLRRSSFNFLS